MINMELARRKGLDQYEIDTIEAIHVRVDRLMETARLGNFNQTTYNWIENLEYSLQDLWGFEQNEKFHTHKHRYKWACRWIGSKWKCLDTGEELVIGEDIEYGDYIRVGNGAVDLGNHYYSRICGNVVEIKTQEIQIG